MGSNYWMFVETEENAAITRGLGYEIFGVGPKYRKRANRMQKNDRVIFYTSLTRKWTASATITKKCYEDTTVVWKPESTPNEFKFRVALKPDYILDESDYIDGLKIGPGLEYVRKWSPETWPLAFWDRLHLLPQRDFKLLEGEMIRIKTGRPTEIASDRKSRQSRRPYSRGPNSRNSTANPRT
ncbi:MAG: EVE domain-containing protein [Chloroflexota bacterium]|nr:EVE domain-containing protein [Chloroflexota bacterium]